MEKLGADAGAVAELTSQLLSLQDQMSHITAHFELVLGKYDSLDSKFDFICSKVDGLYLADGMVVSGIPIALHEMQVQATDESNPPYSPRAFSAMSEGGRGSEGDMSPSLSSFSMKNRQRKQRVLALLLVSNRLLLLRSAKWWTLR